MESASLSINHCRGWMLAFFSAAVILLVPLHWHLAGAIFWLACGILVFLDREVIVKRRMGVLLGVIALLSATDINTSTSNRNFLQVGIPFLLVILIPALFLRKTDPGVIRYRLLPKTWRRADVIYTLLSAPLAWAILKFYWWVNPDLYLNWSMPPDPNQEEIRRLFLGINGVGIWDELFFINTVFAMLRSIFPYLISNMIQAVVYTSVLSDMAFTGIGPLIVYGFAWTQGAMFEKSEGLIWVLIVHLVVDFFLVAAIVGSYYPGYGLDYLWRHGM